MVRRLSLSWLVALGLVSFLLGAPATALGDLRGDFNGDGRDDLAVGVVGEDLGGASNAGAVNVLYGGPGGLSATGDQFWRQNSTGVLGASEKDDSFGYALAAGDFNGDGRDDLAVGVPDEDIGGVATVGAVNVLYGGAGGLSATGNQLWHQDSPGVLDTAEPATGSARPWPRATSMATAVTIWRSGVPQTSRGRLCAGAVNVLYGGSGGLSATGNQFWSQDSPGVLDAAEPLDVFGGSLAAGDINGDGRDDLAVGVFSEDLGSVGDAGAVNVLYGGAGGLSATGNQFWTRTAPASSTPPRSSTSSAGPWPRATSTATPATTWPSAYRRGRGGRQ